MAFEPMVLDSPMNCLDAALRIRASKDEATSLTDGTHSVNPISVLHESQFRMLGQNFLEFPRVPELICIAYILGDKLYCGGQFF